MAKLTEEMVVARTRNSDLPTIKKLNCWGSELADVSIIRRMRGVQVLALSVNHIGTLADFEGCEQLTELYLRKNKIEDLSELAYLQSLPHLKSLWLEENPCVEKAGPNYRLIVLRALPNLKVLDNVEVTPEEVNEAMRSSVRREEPPIYEEQYQEPVPTQHPQEYRQTSPIRERSPPNREQMFNKAAEFEITNSPLQRLQRQSNNDFFEIRTRSPASDQDGYYSSAAASTNSNNNNNNRESVPRERGTLASSISTQSMKEYYQSDYQHRTPNGGNAQYRHSQTDLSEWDEHQETLNGNGGGGGGRGRRSMAHNDRDVPASYGRASMGHAAVHRDDWEEEKVDVRRRMSSAHLDHRRSDSRSHDTTVVPNSVLNHYASLQRRPVHRNANLLSATLCLIKELDLSSLEVVEHAVRCRIDELHAHAE